MPVELHIRLLGAFELRASDGRPFGRHLGRLPGFDRRRACGNRLGQLAQAARRQRECGDRSRRGGNFQGRRSGGVGDRLFFRPRLEGLLLALVSLNLPVGTLGNGSDLPHGPGLVDRRQAGVVAANPVGWPQSGRCGLAFGGGRLGVIAVNAGGQNQHGQGNRGKSAAAADHRVACAHRLCHPPRPA